MDSKFGKFGHVNRVDFEDGREDASQTNPYRHEEGRTGDALAAYNDGWAFGESSMEQYYAEQE